MSDDKNISYYQVNRDKILEQMKKPTKCELCGHIVSHCYLIKHQGTGLCNRRQEKTKQRMNILNEIRFIHEKMKTMQDEIYLLKNF